MIQRALAVFAASLVIFATQSPAQQVRDLELAVAGRQITFDPINATFTHQTTVSRYVLDDGTVLQDPGIDPLAGSSVTFAGTYSGSDLTGLSDLTLNGMITISQATGAVKVFVVLDPGAMASTFGNGPLGNYPRWLRNQSHLGLPTVQVNGVVSPALAQFAARVATNGLTGRSELRVQANPALAMLRSDASLPAGDFDARVATSGAGDLAIGVINATEVEIYNVFSTNLAMPTTSGNYFGLLSDPIASAIVASPLGTVPFHVVPDALGTYCYSVPTGVVPLGLSLDYVCLQYTPGVKLEGSPPQNIVF